MFRSILPKLILRRKINETRNRVYVGNDNRYGINLHRTRNMEVCMTPEEFKERMKACYTMHKRKLGDLEAEHIAADELMCQCLSEAGYGEGVKEFKGGWYS